MVITTWVLALYIIATGERYVYQNEFKTAAACKEAFPAIKAKILKANPQVKEGDEPFVLLCEPQNKKG